MGSLDMFLLLLSLLLSVLHVSLSGDCGIYTVGDCLPLQDTVLGVELLPCDVEDVHLCVSLCQQFCLVTANCNFFSYHTDSQECYLIQETSENEFLSSCDVVAGPDSPTLEECTEQPPEDDCDRFVGQDCVYLGESLFDVNDIGSAFECQTMLIEFSLLFKATYFVYDVSPTHTCQLMDTDSRTCSSVAGPRVPGYDKCQSTRNISNISVPII